MPRLLPATASALLLGALFSLSVVVPATAAPKTSTAGAIPTEEAPEVATVEPTYDPAEAVAWDLEDLNALLAAEGSFTYTLAADGVSASVQCTQEVLEATAAQLKVRLSMLSTYDNGDSSEYELIQTVNWDQLPDQVAYEMGSTLGGVLTPENLASVSALTAPEGLAGQDPDTLPLFFIGYTATTDSGAIVNETNQYSNGVVTESTDPEASAQVELFLFNEADALDAADILDDLWYLAKELQDS